jgi:ABC-type branched-subunit amino acid transport system permease subunit
MLSAEQKIKKSKTVAIVLTVILGPIGLIYGSYIGAVVMFVVPVILSYLWFSPFIFDLEIQSY